MKIKFTAFNGGQEHFEFDVDSLEEGEKLEKFLLSKDEHGKIYVVPMIHYKGNSVYPGPVLEKIQ